MKLLFLVFFVLFLKDGDSTLSKSDKKSKPAKSRKSSPSKAVPQLNTEPTVVSTYMEAKTILAEHDQLNYNSKNFPNPSLAYVTPWNSKGYDIAKWAAKKFTHISPVWFQLKPNFSGSKKSCQIGGMHDIDQGWIKDIRKNNSEIHIVPRFIMEGWSRDEANELLLNELLQRDCLQNVLNLLLRNEMQGAVFEIWLQFLSVLRGSHRVELHELIADWSEKFHSNKLQIIITVTPPLDSNLEPTGIILPEDFSLLIGNVDFVNVMTYDYQSTRFEGIAPLGWIKSNLQYLLAEAPQGWSSILMGLNFYGYELVAGRMNSVIGLRYLELLSMENVHVSWDARSQEHFLISMDEDMISYYPSIASLKLRLELAERLKVGIAIWEIGQGLDYFTSVL